MTKETALAYCRDYIKVNVPDNKDCIATVTFKGDERIIFNDDKYIVGHIDRDLAIALKTLLER